VAKAYILGYEKRHQEFDEDGNKSSDKHWVALLKCIDETIAVSRRQQHLIRAN
jgi:two-component system response regulator AlgR